MSILKLSGAEDIVTCNARGLFKHAGAEALIPVAAEVTTGLAAWSDLGLRGVMVLMACLMASACVEESKEKRHEVHSAGMSSDTTGGVRDVPLPPPSPLGANSNLTLSDDAQTPTKDARGRTPKTAHDPTPKDARILTPKTARGRTPQNLSPGGPSASTHHVKGMETHPRDKAPSPTAETTTASAQDTESQPQTNQGGRWVIAMVGDLLFHKRLQRQAYRARRGFLTIFEEFLPSLRAADITYGNLEGTIAPELTRLGRRVPGVGRTYDGVVYTAFPTFNYHRRLAKDLADAGFDVVSTANNHGWDRRLPGALATLKELASQGVAATGTRASHSAPWHVIVERNGLRAAFIACAERSNLTPEVEGHLLMCGDGATVAARITELVARSDVDVVLVTPHWGLQYRSTPTATQQALGRRWIEAGATVVAGAHPHVLQPGEWVTRRDGSRGYIAYSLGNFCSTMNRVPRRLTALLEVHLERQQNGDVALKHVTPIPGRMRLGHVPLQVLNLNERRRGEAHRQRVRAFFEPLTPP